MVEECEDGAAVDDEEPKRGLAKVVGAVKDALTPNSDEAEPEAGEPPREGCDVVPTEREFRRPIAYDVDYVHHGVKYRSRMPYDPGNRVRVCVSLTPIVSDDRCERLRPGSPRSSIPPASDPVRQRPHPALPPHGRRPNPPRPPTRHPHPRV